VLGYEVLLLQQLQLSLKNLLIMYLLSLLNIFLHFQEKIDFHGFYSPWKIWKNLPLSSVEGDIVGPRVPPSPPPEKLVDQPSFSLHNTSGEEEAVRHTTLDSRMRGIPASSLRI